MNYSEMEVYRGDKPYIFVSYAHADSEQVIPLVKAMQDAGYRIWYDLGIEAGTEWSNNIAKHLKDCSVFLFFASKNSARSENCLDEVAYAKSHNKTALLIYLEEDVTLPVGTDMQTARFQKMFLSRQKDMAEFMNGIAEAEMFDCCADSVVLSETNAPIPKSAKQSTQQSAKKNNKLAIIIAAVLLLAAIIAAVILGTGGDNSTDTQEEDTGAASESTGAQTDAITEEEPPAAIELSDSIKDHTFRLNGTVYKLPIAFSVLTQEGWTIGSGSVSADTYIGGISSTALTFVKDGASIYATVYNDSENASRIKDCLIGGLEIDKGSNIDFCVAAEIKPSSSIIEMIAAFGAPTSRTEGSDYVSLEWEISDYSRIEAMIYSGDMEKYSSLAITNVALLAEPAEINTAAPKYLDSYVAPTELGDDLFSGNISLGGVVYSLPVPLRELLANGWSIATGKGSVISGETIDLTLRKGMTEITAYCENRALYKTTPENCIVVKIYADKDLSPAVLLPGNIYPGMPAEALKEAVSAEMEIYESSYSVTYSYGEYRNRDFWVYLSVDKESNLLSYFTLKNTSAEPTFLD